jgi:hypothetical protein
VDHIEGGNNFQDPFSGAIFSASSNGALVWRRGSSQSSASLIQWLNRSGRSLGFVGEAADFSFPAPSPDDKKMAVAIRDPEIKTRDIRGVDLIGGTRTQLTFNPSDDLDPSGRRTEHGLSSPPTGRDKGQSIRDWRTGRGRRSWCSTGRTDKKRRELVTRR